MKSILLNSEFRKKYFYSAKGSKSRFWQKYFLNFHTVSSKVMNFKLPAANPDKIKELRSPLIASMAKSFLLNNSLFMPELNKDPYLSEAVSSTSWSKMPITITGMEV